MKPSSVPEILEMAKGLKGKGRYEFIRSVFDAYARINFMGYTGMRKSQILALLFENETLEACVENPEYRSFVISVMKHYIERSSEDGVGSHLESCLWAMSKYPKNHRAPEFLELSSEVAETIKPYVLAADDHYKMTHIVLPLSTAFTSADKQSEGMNVIRSSVANTLFTRRPLYDVGFLVGTSTGTLSLKDFSEFLRCIRRQPLEGFFQVVVGAYITNTDEDIESALREAMEVEELTRVSDSE
jgi:hypothetical protein